jgi:multicomponent Na+:H+ antiporter subunit E
MASFLPFFCLQSLRGGVDVAWRAFHPGLPIHPCLVHYPLRLRETPARVFMANVVSLLPGTLSADIDGDSLIVHALDGRLPVAEQLAVLESRVANVFRIALPDR